MITPTSGGDARWWRFHAALAAGDRAQLPAALDPGVAIFESGDAKLSREEQARHQLNGAIDYVAVTKTEVIDRRGGGDGDVAWVLSRSKTSGRIGNKEVSSSAPESLVLERGGDGAWRIVHIHWSSHPLDPVEPQPWIAQGPPVRAKREVRASDRERPRG